MYEYKAKVTDIIDGDTIKVDIDLGFGIYYYNQTVRLARINCPELKTTEGKTVANIITGKLLNKDIVVKTKKDKKEKFGRYLGEIFLDDININNWLVENNYATTYN